MKLKKPAKSLLTVLSLSLITGCVSFPKLRPHIISLKNGKCGEYEVLKQDDACDVVYVFKQWHDISVCEGFIALPPEDIEKLKNYQQQMCTRPK